MLHFWILATLFGILAGWYLVWPRHWIFDVGFLLLIAAPVAARVFLYLYLSPHPRDYRLDVLGHLAWIRLALVSLLLFRGWQPGAFGVWPRGREWGVGTVYFLVIILPLSFLATRLHLYRYAPAHGPFLEDSPHRGGNLLRHFMGSGTFGRVIFPRCGGACPARQLAFTAAGDFGIVRSLRLFALMARGLSQLAGCRRHNGARGGLRNGLRQHRKCPNVHGHARPHSSGRPGLLPFVRLLPKRSRTTEERPSPRPGDDQ